MVVLSTNLVVLFTNHLLFYYSSSKTSEDPHEFIVKLQHYLLDELEDSKDNPGHTLHGEKYDDDLFIPMTSDGSWITIWYSQDVHHTFQIKYRKTLLFCSDVVHCGGHPGVDLKTGTNYYIQKMNILAVFLKTKHKLYSTAIEN